MTEQDIDDHMAMAIQLRAICERDPDQRRRHFEFQVLQALWIIILIVATGRRFFIAPRMQEWRTETLRYADAFGNPSRDAIVYRREKTFPEPDWNTVAK